MRVFTILISCLLIFSSCKQKNNQQVNPMTRGDSFGNLNLETDKAVYSPGETVTFKMSMLPENTKVRYLHLNEVLKEDPVNSLTWTWHPPTTNYKGYMIEIYSKSGEEDKTLGSIAVDVSSNGIYFPRNGFLSHYDEVGQEKIDSVMRKLNRYHMNVVQFQDWEYKHHLPLAGTVSNPAENWKEIGNRTNYKQTIEKYIQRAKHYNMKTLSYNLLYGALDDAKGDGVRDEWFMYVDKQHKKKEVLTMQKPPFKSDISFTDPANSEWQNYIGARTKEAFEVYDFDGYQVDQVGNRDKNLYDYSGNLIDLPATYKPFLESMKTQMRDKLLVMNAVNQYGQKNSISKSPVNFLYSEVWAPDEGYKDLARIIQENDEWGNGIKKSVLCAYMNYNLAGERGWFNTPGVLLTNAAIFSFGGAHLELGEHMLGREYFPNNNLQMKADLEKSIIVYYDFLTGYQNLLRDGGSFNNVQVYCTNGKMDIAAWPPKNGKVSVQGKLMGTKQILHFINFSNASSLEWRDADGKQPEPEIVQEANIVIKYSNPVSKVWVASPDINFGIPQHLEFTQAGDLISFSLPLLKYWDMVVIE